MSEERSEHNTHGYTISHDELSQAFTEQVLSDARESGDGIVPPSVVIRLILLAVSPEYARELIEKAESLATDTS